MSETNDNLPISNANQTTYAKAKIYAKLADACYNRNESPIPVGWEKINLNLIDSTEDPIYDIIETESGFQGCIFYNNTLNEYVVAYRGTEFNRELFKDFVEADCEGFGRDNIPRQFNDAINLLNTAKNIRDVEHASR